jgi:FtsH-binding integral membrane protein
MNHENVKRKEIKEKITHELYELMGISLYLAFFFCAVATYRMLLLNEFRVSYFDYGAELINALVVAKVILIGEYAHLGKKHEAKPLLLSAVYKAFLFGLLVFGFHIVEEAIKRLWHGENIAGHSTICASRTCSLAASSYSVPSFLSLGFWSCAGYWGKTNSTTCSSKPAVMSFLCLPIFTYKRPCIGKFTADTACQI